MERSLTQLTTPTCQPKLTGGVGADCIDAFGLEGKLIDGRYSVEQVVGHGGYGVVYRAQHLRLDAPVALKVLRIPRRVKGKEREQFVERFLQEGKLLFRLGSIHPAIVRVFEAGVLTSEDGVIAPYLVMDWLKGVTLDRQLELLRDVDQQQLELSEVVTLLNPIADSLSMAHAIGVAHLDVKPGNIFLLDQGEHVVPKLLDFGLAKIVTKESGSSELSGEGTAYRMAMTPAYGAPEQWRQQLGPTGPWTDVHSLALVCVELLVGRRPLSGSNAEQLMNECLDESCRPTPGRLGLPLSARVEKVFLRALQVNPQARFRDVSAFWRRLCQAADVSVSRTLSIPLIQFPLAHTPNRVGRGVSTHDSTLMSRSTSNCQVRKRRAGRFPRWPLSVSSAAAREFYRWIVPAAVAVAALVLLTVVGRESGVTPAGHWQPIHWSLSRWALPTWAVPPTLSIIATDRADCSLTRRRMGLCESESDRTPDRLAIGFNPNSTGRTNVQNHVGPSLPQLTYKGPKPAVAPTQGQGPDATEQRSEAKPTDLLHHEALIKRN